MIPSLAEARAGRTSRRLGMRSHAGVALKMFEILARENVHVHLISTSEIKISCVIDAKYAELVVRSLHDGFELGKSKT